MADPAWILCLCGSEIYIKSGSALFSKLNDMNKSLSFIIPIVCILFLSGCQAIGDIFKAGVWVGVLVVVGIVALIIFLISRGSGKN
jgi:hypothetical protein